MTQDRNPSQSPEKENANGRQNDQFESDTQRIVHRHLQNKNDVITEEDIAGVRVGMMPTEFDNAASELMQDAVAGAELPSDEEKTTDEKITPWDALESEKE